MRSSLDKSGHSSMALLSLSVWDRKVMQMTFQGKGEATVDIRYLTSVVTVPHDVS